MPTAGLGLAGEAGAGAGAAEGAGLEGEPPLVLLLEQDDSRAKEGSAQAKVNNRNL